jgi:two-component system sensor histidine kinase RegB
MLRVDAGFSQALISLLDNAADASEMAGSHRIVMTIMADAQRVQIAIDDDGVGLGERVQRVAGRLIFTTKSHGFGLGLALSHAHLERLQGEVTLAARAEGGTRTLITLPRATLPRAAPAAQLLHG